MLATEFGLATAQPPVVVGHAVLLLSRQFRARDESSAQRPFTSVVAARWRRRCFVICYYGMPLWIASERPHWRRHAPTARRLSPPGMFNRCLPRYLICSPRSLPRWSPVTLASRRHQCRLSAARRRRVHGDALRVAVAWRGSRQNTPASAREAAGLQLSRMRARLPPACLRLFVRLNVATARPMLFVLPVLPHCPPACRLSLPNWPVCRAVRRVVDCRG